MVVTGGSTMLRATSNIIRKSPLPSELQPARSTVARTVRVSLTRTLWVGDVVDVAIDLAISRSNCLIVQGIVILEPLSAIAAERAQCEVVDVRTADGQRPLERYADDYSFVEASFAELLEWNIGESRIGADLDTIGEAP